MTNADFIKLIKEQINLDIEELDDFSKPGLIYCEIPRTKINDLKLLCRRKSIWIEQHLHNYFFIVTGREWDYEKWCWKECAMGEEQ